MASESRSHRIPLNPSFVTSWLGKTQAKLFSLLVLSLIVWDCCKGQDLVEGRTVCTFPSGVELKVLTFDPIVLPPMAFFFSRYGNSLLPLLRSENLESFSSSPPTTPIPIQSTSEFCWLHEIGRESDHRSSHGPLPLWSEAPSCLTWATAVAASPVPCFCSSLLYCICSPAARWSSLKISQSMSLLSSKPFKGFPCHSE